MRYLYSALLFILLPLIVLRLFWKSRRFPAYRQRIGERFALKSALKDPVDIWLHAVSLGEVIAAIPLIEKLLLQQQRIMVTTTTPSGSAKILSAFGSKIEHQYLPYDLMFLQRRFLKQIQAKKVIIMETELWPNLLHTVKRQAIPLLLVNARLSEQSFKGYQKIRMLLKPALRGFSKILTQSAADAERFLDLGADANQVKVIGNIKFDPPPLNTKQLNTIKECIARLGESKFIWIAASTHHNEEQQILECFSDLKKQFPQMVLLIAPRHPERFEEIIQVVRNSGFKTGTRSQSDQWNTDMEVIVLDSIGELTAFYSISHLAFVGGSFVPVGGHNMLEPAQAGVPVICGPHLHNFQAISQELLSSEAMKLVKDKTQLTETIRELFNNEKHRKQLVCHANGVLERNRGALERYLEFC